MVHLSCVYIRATVAAAVLSGMPLAWAQTVYRCAHLYSDRPCPGAVAIEASDTRTPQQKVQSDSATREISRTAERMERERHALERAQLRSAAARQPMPAVSAPHSARGRAAQVRALQRSDDPPFTAVARVPPAPAKPDTAKSAAAPAPGG